MSNTKSFYLPNLYRNKFFISTNSQIFKLVIRLLSIYFYIIDNIFDINKNDTKSHNRTLFIMLLFTLSILFISFILSTLSTLSTLVILLEQFAIIFDKSFIIINYQIILM